MVRTNYFWSLVRGTTEAKKRHFLSHNPMPEPMGREEKTKS